jgi:hypothetical protein
MLLSQQQWSSVTSFVISRTVTLERNKRRKKKKEEIEAEIIKSSSTRGTTSLYAYGVSR